jgi:hypothetical protein
MWRIRSTLSSQFRVSFEDSDPEANQKLHEYEEALFLNQNRNALTTLPKTELEGDLYESVQLGPDRVVLLPKPFTFRLRLLPGHPLADSPKKTGRTVCVYDNAGEHFLPGNDKTGAPGTRHLAFSKALLFVFDPTQHPTIRERCRGKTNDPQIEEDLVSYRQDHILTEAAKRIRAEKAIGLDERDQRPLIVVVTKYDAWASLANNNELKTEWIIRETSYEGMCGIHVDQLRAISNQIRDILMEHIPEIVAAAEAFSDDVTFIPVSALGNTPEEIPGMNASNDGHRKALGIRPRDIKPVWAEIPFLYAIHRCISGVIPKYKKANQAPS